MNDGILIQNQDITMQNSMISMNMMKKSRVKPKFFKLLGQIMNEHVDVIFF